jgi:hypothetical protein
MDNHGEDNTPLINIFQKLRDKKSNQILLEIFNFINKQFDEIIKTEKSNNIPIIIQDFIYSLTLDFIKCWDLEVDKVIYYAEIVEGFELLILKSLHNKLFQIQPEDTKFDKICKRFSFVTLKHLNVEIIIDEFELANQMKG